MDGFYVSHVYVDYALNLFFNFDSLLMRILRKHSHLNYSGYYFNFNCIQISLSIKLFYTIFQRCVLMHLNSIENLPLFSTFHLMVCDITDHPSQKDSLLKLVIRIGLLS